MHVLHVLQQEVNMSPLVSIRLVGLLKQCKLQGMSYDPFML